MKNKGFTLVELLVVITLIVIISIAAGVGINEMFERQRERNYAHFIKTITNAACTYAEVKNIETNSSVTIKILMDNGYLSKKLENPMTKKTISDKTNNINENTIVNIRMNNNKRECSID